MTSLPRIFTIFSSEWVRGINPYISRRSFSSGIGPSFCAMQSIYPCAKIISGYLSLSVLNTKSKSQESILCEHTVKRKITRGAWPDARSSSMTSQQPSMVIVSRLSMMRSRSFTVTQEKRSSAPISYAVITTPRAQFSGHTYI